MTHLAVALVAAFLVFAVMKLRLDTVQSDHRASVASIRKEHGDALTTLRADHQTAVDKRSAEVQAEQAAITNRYEKALNDATTRQAALRADLGAARAAARSLREQADAAARRIHLPDAPPGAVAEYAAASGELLAQCSAAYQELGEKADGHAADARTLKAAWPVAPAQ